MAQDRVRDAIIIGAGISGLSAGKLLQEGGHDILILEANDRVGGRMLNFKDPAVTYTDVGACYVGPSQDRIMRLAKEFGVDTFDCHDDGVPVILNRGKWMTMTGSNPTTWNPLVMMDVNHFWHLIDDMIKKIPVETPWDFPEAEEWDSMTVQEWADKNFWFQLTKDILALHTLAIFCVEPRDISLLYFLWFFKAGGGYLRLVATKKGAQEKEFIGGSERIAIAMADRIGKDRVLLESPVSSVTQTEAGVTVCTKGGKTYKAKYVIAAIPPAVINKIAFSPPLSSLRNQLNQRFPMGSVIKVILFYERAFWRHQNFSALSLCDGIVNSTIDDWKHGNPHPAIVGFIAGDDARETCHLTKEERRDMIAKQYAEMYMSKEALTPMFYVEKNWLEEPYIGGGYMGFTPPGVVTKYFKVLRQHEGRVYFAGSETATKWPGYMDGGVQAGERAAREILYDMGKIRRDEIWQEEPENKDMPLLQFEQLFLERTLPSVSGFLRFAGATTALCAIGGILWKHGDAFRKIFNK